MEHWRWAGSWFWRFLASSTSASYTSVIVNSCLFVLLDSMAVGELVVLIENSFDKRSADES